VDGRGWARIPTEDATLLGVTCTGNRRQGLTIGHSRDVVVRDCEFNDTHGTAPQCGIDIEPNAPGSALRVRIESCRVRGNRGSGVQIYEHSRDVTVRGCTIEGNLGYGVLAVGTEGGLIVDNVIHRNGYEGIELRRGTVGYQLSGNQMTGNATRRTKPRKT
jgi:nitrous oxidase accessory protein NosD